MRESLEELKLWVVQLAAVFDSDEEPKLNHYSVFVESPELALGIVEILAELSDEEEERSFYAACVFALDICVAELQIEIERGNKSALKIMDHLMGSLSAIIGSKKQSLSFWLPILNVFYEVHAELTDELKNAYFELANAEDGYSPDEEATHLSAIRELILELSDLSVFDITEHFFAQSYAMPPDFFADLVIDLYNIEEGHEIALLTLLHPKQEVREVVVDVLDELMDDLLLSPTALTRLQTIKTWYPDSYHDVFQRWIKLQRKKGVVFDTGNKNTTLVSIKASEVDGSGAQGIFIHLKKGRKHRLCGMLYKLGVGIKEAWVSPLISKKEVDTYFDKAFEDNLMLLEVDLEYLTVMTQHFLALMVRDARLPDLHLLEIQEELGLQWRPEALAISALMDQLSVQISPFTEKSVQESFKRSKAWSKNKSYTESWYMESSEIDKLVNGCCSFVDGVKVCRFEEAVALVMSEVMELQRERWLFHFLWMTLWLKTVPLEKAWRDAFIIAYVIYQGQPLNTIPLLQDICYQSVVNSVETMQVRRTHLNRQ